MTDFQSSGDLRKQLRQARKALTAQQQTQHAAQACQHLLAELPQLLPSTPTASSPPIKVSVFLSQDGELGTEPLIKALWQQPQLELYLPALETLPDWHMGFSRYTPATPMKRNPLAFNIPEPDCALQEHLSGEQMDIVIMPLVGFDKQGNRMGMGGGYYDRTFAFKLKHPDARPLLIGWAHSCQQVEQLENQPWDVPLDAIVSEKGLLNFRQAPSA
ncbi:5-formyltetrahydrofolate cyclo-ligase [Thiomicrorhabdus cannonii]|uniref:5-formyltetrahydrofolate cyclo-ligase n=1 Tax=Thiomicrorhabdus cannonii TaxID=2748011 RepID=UPI0015BED890|nr:5-formyltetrahydrofolate cyclo-ligase [Thiomicrorhabdus cannonii]